MGGSAGPGRIAEPCGRKGKSVGTALRESGGVGVGERSGPPGSLRTVGAGGRGGEERSAQ